MLVRTNFEHSDIFNFQYRDARSIVDIVLPDGKPFTRHD